MTDFVRILYSSKDADDYSKARTVDEKLESKLIKTLTNEASVFATTDEDLIALVMAAQMHSLMEAVDREYSIINGKILVDRRQVNDPNIPWAEASKLHYEFDTESSDNKIAVADAIIAGRINGKVISKEKIIESA